MVLFYKFRREKIMLSNSHNSSRLFDNPKTDIAVPSKKEGAVQDKLTLDRLRLIDKYIPATPAKTADDNSVKETTPLTTVRGFGCTI
jgi:hypothetical protein